MGDVVLEEGSVDTVVCWEPGSVSGGVSLGG